MAQGSTLPPAAEYSMTIPTPAMAQIASTNIQQICCTFSTNLSSR